MQKQNKYIKTQNPVNSTHLLAIYKLVISGFTLVELLLSLVIIAGVTISIVQYAKHQLQSITGFSVATNAVDYARASTRYIKTHYALLEELLSSSSGLVIIVSEEVLKSEGFLPNNYPNTNSLRQYPCLTIFYEANQVQGYVYYRINSSNKSKELEDMQLISGLEHVGSMIGLYKNGQVTGINNSWSLSKDMADTLFVATGNVDPSQGKNPSIYTCSGNVVAINSYVVSTAVMQNLNNRIPNDNSLHQYPDNIIPVGNKENANTMQTDLNMDSRNDGTAHANYKRQNNIIFQMNPNCIMDPNQPATMQNYDPNPEKDGKNPINWNYPNTLGCKNRQLGLSESSDTNGRVVITVTGFAEGGDKIEYDKYNESLPSALKKIRPQVGDLVVDSIQPTAEVQIGTPCTSFEIGTMAKQAIDVNPWNNLYISQVQCMKSPLCPILSGDFCYQAIQNVTIIGKPQATDANKHYPTSVICPSGMFLVDYTENRSALPSWGSRCCQSSLGVCLGYASAHDISWDKVTESYLSGTAALYKIPSGVLKSAVAHYHYTCDAVCVCPSGDAGTWQTTITSYTCSNDVSRIMASIETN